MLSAGAARLYCFNFEIGGIELDFDILGFGKDCDRRRGGVDSSRSLGLGNALHTVYSAFVLEP